MSDNMSVTRVHYFDRQFLRTQDFTDEQAYHLEMRRRHNIGQHRWGIVHGLELEPNAFAVEPGLAIDGYGRELVLGARTAISKTAFDDKGSDALDVWLIYSRTESDAAPAGYAADDDDEAFYRFQEQPQIWLRQHDLDLEPRKPPEVPAGDLDFDPSRTPPDEVSDDWPVFLGTVTRDRSDPADPVYTVDGSQRPYAGLVGAEVASPQQPRVRVEIGGDEQEDQQDNAFAVFLPVAQVGQEDPKNQTTVEEKKAFDIDRDGNVGVYGPLTLRGDLKVEQGALDFSVGRQQIEEEGWRIYRVDHDGSGNLQPEELRLEIGQDGEAVIGVWSDDDKTFQPCLKVTKGDGGTKPTVTVHGDLRVHGKLKEVPATQEIVTSDTLPPLSQDAIRDRAHTPESERFRTSTFLSGVGGSHVLLTEQQQGPVVAAQPAVETPQGAAESLAQDPEGVRAFVRQVVEQGGAAAKALRDEMAKSTSKGKKSGSKSKGKGGD